MRIISGRCKGRKLITPKDHKIRPTSDRVRESLFNILGNHVEDATVLDLFAGTGALGIESLSRGAESALFLDISDAACRIIKENVTLCKLEHQTRVVQWDLSKKALPPTLMETPFSLIFMDPPYDKGFIKTLLDTGNLMDLLDPDGTIVIEHTPKEPIPDPLNGFILSDQRRYGKTLISFLTKK